MYKDKKYRDLHTANPFIKQEPACEDLTRLKNDVDKGWRYFWAKRGYAKQPPHVSNRTIGYFDMP